MPPKKKVKMSTKTDSTETHVPNLPLDDGAIRSMNLRTSNKAVSMLVSVSTGNNAHIAMYSKTRDEYALKVELKALERFSLKPMVITSGFLKGRQVLVLEPDQTPTTSVSFLSLPPEVRNLIYSALLVQSDGDPCEVRGNQLKHIRCVGLDGLSPFGLFRANRQVYQEAATVYYGWNQFNFTDTTTLAHFLSRIGSSAKYLRRVAVDGITKSSAFKAGRLLAAAKNLELLRLSPSGHGSYLAGRTSNTDTHYIVSAFLPVFEGLQKIANDREKVFSIVRAHNATSTCYAHRMRVADMSRYGCSCVTDEKFLAELKKIFKMFIKDKDVGGNEVPEPCIPSAESLLAAERLCAEEDLIDYSDEELQV